ncbi:CoA-acylating methylmalonate-semialdehyde dehydrogenase [Anaerolineae bacterium CFX9]|jgi:malonate-semialdehyde dehydrogenase (acetylating)/methylmalonate-semialdehyde dehydrogenase|nr:CoA-acylating methylmalonate-semialdehyde dehydrogenase [Kamptonema cortianum]MDL1901041.1 CoA-acylating methylmalonate-semialdehyde dehydrogenase [Anaerolineae bacterium CFX9]
MVKQLKQYIGGEWVTSTSSTYLPVINPATCEVIAEVPDGTREDVDKAVRAAQAVYDEWRSTSVLNRVQYMYRLKSLLEENFEELTETIVRENGKTRDEARGEVRRGIESVDFATQIPSLMRGYKLEDVASGIDEVAERQPMGVFAAITPFNFPLMVPLWFLPTAITCGNTYVVKPSPQTPVSMDLLYRILDELDLPEGVVNLVHGGREASMAVMEHPGIVGVSFVGSTPVAKIVYETCAKHGKRVQAQGGAKNYIAVMPDADIQASAANIMGSAFGCAGQRCLAGSVVVAVGDAYEPLKEELVKRAANLRVGYGLEETTQMGTVISADARERIERMISEGLREGAQIALDGRGKTVEGYENGTFVGPTILDGVTKDMTVAKDEIFGPVLSIMRAESFDEVVDLINSSRYGNAASIFTNNGGYAREFKYRVNAGNIGINVGVAAATASFPFGGKKDSFFGDLHGQGPDAIDFFMDRKVVIERWL